MNDPQALLDAMDQHAADLGLSERISYSRAMHIDTRAIDDVSRDKLVAIAKSRAIDPTVFDEFPLFMFGGEITSSRWDAYDTQMRDSSLQNYAKESSIGVSYLSGHNNRMDPHGGTLTGVYTKGEGKKPSTVRADVYMIQDPGSAGFISKIRAGIVKDQSIGFYGGEYMCTICGRDMAQWWTEDGCMHFLGMMYTPLDKNGKPKEGAEKVKARAGIENAHLAEVSGVYDGATPASMIDKARALAAQGEIPHEMRELVQVRYNILLPGGSRSFPVAKREVAKMTDEEIQELRDSLARVTRERDQRAKCVSDTTAIVQRVKLPSTLEGAELPVVVEHLVAENARLIPMADDGRKYRSDLIASALEEGVRAFGAEFQQETYSSVLNASPIEAIKRMRDDWSSVAEKTFPKGGRQTTTEGEGDKPKPPTKTDRARQRAFMG